MKLKFQLNNRRNLLITGAVLINLLIFGLTNPFNSSAFLVILGFIVAGTDLIGLTIAFLSFVGLMIPSVQVKKRRLSLAIGSFELVLLALASIGQLGWRDLFVVTVIWLIGYLYSTYLHLAVQPSK